MSLFAQMVASPAWMANLFAGATGFLATASFTPVALVLFVENALVLVLAVLAGDVALRIFANRRITAPPPPLERRELAYVVSTLVLNTAVTVVGLYLWRAGKIRFRSDHGVLAWLDVPLLLLTMDLAMYALHRLAHVEPIYRLIHAPHHRYDRPRPLTLFVLSPLEALGFGGLWLVVIYVYDASWLGMSVYLVLNVVFGVIGHLGVEPLPARLRDAPLLRWLGTSTFHAKHHQDRAHNFGFYTSLWDRLFRTLQRSP
jgi:lathosterol oxidase